MKRILLLGIILAICILAMPQGVSAIDDDVHAVPISANVADVLTCTAVGGDSTDSWSLTRGQDNVLYGAEGVTLTVDSTFDWNLVAEDLSGSESIGHMYDSGVDKFLTKPFKIEGIDTDGMMPLEIPVDIEEGSPQAVFTYYHDISQEVLVTDYSGDSYAITVTFTCSQAIPSE